MTINPTNGIVQWTPSAAGSFNVTIKAANGIRPDATQSFTINIQSGTTFAPIITSTPVTSGTVGVLYTYDVETDASPNPTYSLTAAPSGMTINSTTGLCRVRANSICCFYVTLKLPVADGVHCINPVDELIVIPDGNAVMNMLDWTSICLHIISINRPTVPLVTGVDVIIERMYYVIEHLL